MLKHDESAAGGQDTQISSFLFIRLRSLFYLHSIVNDQIHKFIEALAQHRVRVAAQIIYAVDIPLSFLQYEWPIAHKAR